MTTKKAAVSSPTMTAGSPSSRAAEILALAQASGQTNWLTALPPSEKELLVEIRDRWRATREMTGVSAASLAKTLIAQMPETRFPCKKGLSEWLLHADAP
jgi:hypothetical protein